MKLCRTIFLLFGVFFAILMVASPIMVSAQGTGTCPEGYICFDNPLKQGDIISIIKAVTNLLSDIAIPVGILVIVWGGIQIMTGHTTGEKESKVIQGKKTIMWAVIGVGIVLLVKFIIGFVAEILGTPLPPE